MFSISVIESFLVYTSLLFIIPMLGHTADQIYCRRNIYSHYSYLGVLLCIILIFSIVFGARYKVGIDFLNYKRIYEVIQQGTKTDDIIEPGFFIICKVIGGLGLHFFFFFFFFCCIQVSFIIAAFKNRPELLPWIFIILLSTQFLVMMNLVRQMTFVCCFIWLVSRSHKISFLKYGIIIALCTFFLHKSALLALPLYPIIRYDKNLSGSYRFQNLFYWLCIYLGYSHFILDKFEDFSLIASALGYSQYEGFNVLEALFMDPNWGARTYIRIALVMTTILYSHSVRAYFNKDDKYIRFYNLFFWGVCAEIVLYGTNVIARVFLPLYYMKLVIFAYTLYFLSINVRRNYKIFFMWIVYVGLLLMDYSSIFYEATLPDNSSAFQFFWQAD